MKKCLLTFFFLFLASIQAFCFEALNFNGFILDEANVISPENEIALNQVLYELQTKTKADVAVVTLKTLQGEAIEDVSLKIARENKLGDKKLNNGALILVVPNDRKARIEIGYGFEGALNDSKAGRILDEYMIPYFKEENYEEGIIKGTLVLASEIAESYGVKLSFDKPVPPEREDNSDILFIIILLLLLFMGGPGGFIFFGLPGGFRGGGSSGIRFGGGGGFGGGGASRGW